MAFEVGAIVSKLQLDKRGWDSSVKGVKTDQATLANFAKKNSEAMKKMGRTMTLAGGVIVASLGAMVKKASDAEETTAKFGTVFEDVMPKASKEMKNLRDNYGLSTLASKTLLSATGDLLTGLGLQGDTALSLSAKTQQLAVDLASFTNFQGGAEGASLALTKAMLGERESVKALGIVVTEEMVKEELFKQGKESLTGQALLQAKAEATLAIAMSQSKNAIGDYARTSDSFANQQRLLRARLEDLFTTIGTKLIPIVTQATTKVTSIVTKIIDWTQENPELTGTLVKIAGATGAMMLVLGPLLIILPKIAAGIALVNKAAIGGAAGIGSLGIAATGAYVGYKALIAIREKWEKSTGKFTSDETKRWAKLSEELGYFTGAAEKVAVAVAKQTKGQQKSGEVLKELNDLWHKYGENTEKTLKAISRGEAGEEAKKALGELGGAHFKAAQQATEQGKSIDELTTEADALATQLKDKLNKEMGSLNLTKEEATKKAKELAEEEKKLKEEYKDLTKALKIANDEMWDSISTSAKFGGTLKDVVGGALAGVIGDVKELDDSLPTLKTDFETTSDGIVEDTKKVKNEWLQMSERIRDKWTTELGQMLSGAKSWREGISSIWKTIRQQFFDVIAQMITKWTLSFVAKILSGGKNVLSGITGVFKGIGSALTGASSGAGTGGIIGKLGGSFLGTISSMAGPIGIGLLAAKFLDLKAIGKSVSGVLTSAFDAVGGVIKGLGKVVESVFGQSASVFSGLGNLVGGLLTGIGKLVGGGGGSGNVGGWIHESRDRLHDIKNIMYNAFLNNSNAFMVKMDHLNEKVAMIKDLRFPTLIEVNRTIYEQLKSIYTALTHDGTIYVNMTKSLVLERSLSSLGASINENVGALVSPLKDIENTIAEEGGKSRGSIENVGDLIAFGNTGTNRLLDDISMKTCPKKGGAAGSVCVSVGNLGKKLGIQTGAITGALGGVAAIMADVGNTIKAGNQFLKDGFKGIKGVIKGNIVGGGTGGGASIGGGTGGGPPPGFATGGTFIPKKRMDITVHPKELVDIIPFNRSSSRRDSAISIPINNVWNIYGEAAMNPRELERMFDQNINEMTKKIKGYFDRY